MLLVYWLGVIIELKRKLAETAPTFSKWHTQQSAQLCFTASLPQNACGDWALTICLGRHHRAFLCFGSWGAGLGEPTGSIGTRKEQPFSLICFKREPSWTRSERLWGDLPEASGKQRQMATDVPREQKLRSLLLDHVFIFYLLLFW